MRTQLLDIVTVGIALVTLMFAPLGCGEGADDDDAGTPDADVAADAADGGTDGEAGLDDAEAAPDVELWPEPWEFHEGLGDVEEIPAELQPLFVSTGVPELPEPGPNDWLANFDEPGQTFDQFVASGPNLPNDTRYILYLQPLGDAEEFEIPTLEELEIFYEAYFSMEAQVLEPIDPVDYNITERINPYEGQRQLLTEDILNVLMRNMPDDAYSLLAVTMIDLYPEDDWNFVFGQASLAYRVGVFSFARYESIYPEFTVRRAFKVLAHEAGHMYGVYHCTYFHCLMNGANHLGELDASPIHLCPVDLRKLYWSIDFDPVARYERLIEVYQLHELTEEAEWLEDRLLHSGF